MAKRNTEEERQANRDRRREARNTPEAKAERKVRAQKYKDDYSTDADRALVNKRGTSERRAERSDAWAKDGFDLNTFGNQHVSGQEMRQMRNDGMSSTEIEEMSAGMHMTDRATKQLNRKKAKERAIAARDQEVESTIDPVTTDPVTPPPVINPPMDTTTPGTPTPKIPPGLTNPEPGIVRPNTEGTQVIGGDTGNVGKVGDMTTTIGDGNTIIGSPIGNDYSVTIGNTGNMSGGGSGGSGLSNMMSAAAYNALNNNAYNTSQAQLNGNMGAATGIALGEQATGASDRVATLYNMVGESQGYWKNKANAQQGLYLGDVWNQGGHDWVQAPNPESSKDRTSEILGDDDDD